LTCSGKDFGDQHDVSAARPLARKNECHLHGYRHVKQIGRIFSMTNSSTKFQGISGYKEYQTQFSGAR
jgi:hypothetical protein